MTELERKRRIAERLQPEKIADDTLVPILLAFMDEETTQKTTDVTEKGYVAFKNAVLKYVNRVVPHAEAENNSRGVAKMQLDAVQTAYTDDGGVTWTPSSGPQQEDEAEEVDEEGNYIGAFKGKGKGKGGGKACYNCGKEGHLARNCWQSPNTGGKGGKG